MDEVQFGPWRSDGRNRWRLVLGPFACNEFFCNMCGCCMHCFSDCCESRDEGSCFAVQYEFEAVGVARDD